MRRKGGKKEKEEGEGGEKKKHLLSRWAKKKRKEKEVRERDGEIKLLPQVDAYLSQHPLLLLLLIWPKVPRPNASASGDLRCPRKMAHHLGMSPDWSLSLLLRHGIGGTSGTRVTRVPPAVCRNDGGSRLFWTRAATVLRRGLLCKSRRNETNQTASLPKQNSCELLSQVRVQ